jgi:iron complex outermembrane receptor protein
MEWPIGTRRSATAAAASVAFYAAAAATAQAQQSAQTEGNARQNTSASQPGATLASTLPSLSVEGSADNDDTEIPQTINVVTAQQIEETGATSINEALRYIPCRAIPCTTRRFTTKCATGASR